MKKEVKDLSIEDIQKLDMGNGNNASFLVVGKFYFIMTVTHYFLGECVANNSMEIKLKAGVSWIPDTGKLSNFFETGKPQDFEVLPHDSIINRNAVVWISEWHKKLLTK